MSNTLTDLAPVLYSAAVEVSQEPVGFLDGINLNFDDKGAAVGDTIKLPLAPAAASTDYTPAMATSDGTDKIADAVEVSISKSVQTSWHLTGEQIRSLENGASDKEWVRQLIAQGMRTLKNEAEAACADAAYKGASRAWGTEGTTPFASDINDIAAVRKILRDNGAPMADLQLVMDTAASYNLQKLAIYQQAQAAGTDAERRNGIFGKQFGFSMRESGQVDYHTAGTASTGMDTDAIEPVGETTLVMTGADSGTVLAGDIIQNTTQLAAGTDTNKYIVKSATVSGAATGNVIINTPGLRVASGAADEWNLGSSYRANVAFERSAIVGAMRIPLIPENANMRQIPISADNGMTFLLVEIVGDGMITWRLHLAYGFKVIQPEHVAILLG